MKTYSLPLIAALLATVALAQDSKIRTPGADSDTPRIGQPMITPALPPIKRTYGFLMKHPEVKISEPGVIAMAYETATPTPPAIVYYGLTTIDEELDYPRFRYKYRAPGTITDLSTTHTLEFDFRSVLKKMPNTEYEPRINYRLAVFVPGKGERYWDGQVYFDPNTLGDTVNITYGPTVEQVGPNGATIYWETDRPAKSALILRKDGSEQTSKGQSPKPATTKHTITLGNLERDTRYFYRVQSGETIAREYSFKTYGQERPFSFAAMVDSREGVGSGEQTYHGCEARALYALTTDAYYKGADFIITPGDLVNGYTNSVDDFRLQLDAWRRVMRPVHSRIPIYEGMGNHESLIDTYDDGSKYGISLDKRGDDSAEAIFAEMFVNPENGPDNEGPGSPTYKENLYHFDYLTARIFILNNNYWWVSDPHNYGGNLEGYILPNQIEWLREQVKIADEDDKIRHLFFAAQEPPFPNGGHTQDAMWYKQKGGSPLKGGDTNQDGKIDDEDIDIVENRNTLWEIMAGSDKTVAFIAGDEHAYSRLLVSKETNVGHIRKQGGGLANFENPVWQVTSGGAGAPWYDKELDLPWSPMLKAHSTQPHYAMFRVNGGDVFLEVYSQTGQLIDYAQLRKKGKNLTKDKDTQPKD